VPSHAKFRALLPRTADFLVFLSISRPSSRLCAAGAKEDVHYMLAQGHAGVNEVDRHGRSAMHFAAARGDIAMIQVGGTCACVRAFVPGCDALTAAAGSTPGAGQQPRRGGGGLSNCNHDRFGQVLLRHGGKIDIRDAGGKTPQMFAAERCDGDVVRYLVLVHRAAQFSGGSAVDHQVPQRLGSAMHRAPSDDLIHRHMCVHRKRAAQRAQATPTWNSNFITNKCWSCSASSWSGLEDDLRQPHHRNPLHPRKKNPLKGSMLMCARRRQPKASSPQYLLMLMLHLERMPPLSLTVPQQNTPRCHCVGLPSI